MQSCLLNVVCKPQEGALLLCPCLFCPSDNVWCSRRTDAPRCAHFATVISPSCITEQISVGKSAHRDASSRWECQTSFKIVTWTKQTWTKHHNTPPGRSSFKFETKIMSSTSTLFQYLSFDSMYV